MTTPIVTETRRHGSQAGNPTSGGQPIPAPCPPTAPRERRSHGRHGLAERALVSPAAGARMPAGRAKPRATGG